jgi:hypothetical protein
MYEMWQYDIFSCGDGFGREFLKLATEVSI